MNNKTGRMNYKIQNENADSDVEYAMKLNRWLLMPLGIWPLNASSKKFERKLSVISPPICYFILFFMMAPSLVDTFDSENDFKARVEMVGPTSFILMVVLKYCLFIFRGKELKICIDTIIDDWCNVQAKQEREIMIRNAKIDRFLTIICIIFVHCGGSFYTIFSALIKTKSLTRDNNSTVRFLPYPCNYILFDPYVRPVFDIVYIAQCFCGFVLCSITTGICSLAGKFVMHACGQCEIVMSLLENLIDDDKECSDIVERKVAAIIFQHFHIIRFVTHVEDLLKEVCLVEFLGCTLNICLNGYYIITGWESADISRCATFMLTFIAFTFHIFIFCYFGQILTNHCHQIGEASYMIDWYRLPGRQARFLILLIGMANRPINLTAGRMVHLSYICFGNVLKASMAYLNILRAVAI